jgi:hypothetical protein
MKIYIDNSKVHTRILEQTLYLVRSCAYLSKPSKKKSQEDIRNAEKEVELSE